MGPAEIELTPRPKSILTELRKLVVHDQNLDGVLLKNAAFDEENILVLSGREDHQGQAQGAVLKVMKKAAGLAWKDLPPPRAAQARGFAVFPLKSLLKTVSRRLPSYSEADGVILTRAYYNDRAELGAGRAPSVGGFPATLPL